MNIEEFLSEDFIWLNEPVKSQLDVFEKVFTKCQDKGFVSEAFLEKIKEREKVFPTGLQLDGYGVAIPHTDPECVNKQFIAVFTPEEDVSFKRMDDSTAEVKVKIIFVLGLNQPHSQLAMLQELMVLLQDKEAVENLRKTTDKKQMIEYLSDLSKQKQRWKGEK